jgi:hypothetical protein
MIDTKVHVLGRDGIGWVAEADGFRYYLTECCGASAKGSVAGGEPAVVCRCCYSEIDPMLGDVPPTPGKCSCMTLGGVTYGANFCPVHGTVSASRTLDTTAVPPVDEWQAAAKVEGRPIPEYEVLPA